MSAKPILYLANNYGFSKIERAGPLQEFVKVLTDLGVEVWEPFERNNQIDFSKKGWAYQVGQDDYADVRNSDGTFAIVNGCPPDEGVMIELGMAIALKKAVFLFRDDFRRSTDSEDYPLNLMLFTGFPEGAWREYFFTSFEEIRDPNKALVKWLNQFESA